MDVDKRNSKVMGIFTTKEVAIDQCDKLLPTLNYDNHLVIWEVEKLDCIPWAVSIIYYKWGKMNNIFN